MKTQHPIELPPLRRGLHDLTARIAAVVERSRPRVGLCHIFLQHTSASLLIQENADPRVLTDLEAWFSRMVPDGDPRYTHTEEGPDDMPSHLRAALTQPSLTVPISEGHLALGTWQAIYLFEHRTAPHRRRLIITLDAD
ncbi:MAG: secondary thiamine-phosphate synthase enzyme YjbQ [Polyangiaceae bacterium]